MRKWTVVFFSIIILTQTGFALQRYVTDFGTNPPFSHCLNVAVSPSGYVFVTNANEIHCFRPNGTLKFTYPATSIDGFYVIEASPTGIDTVIAVGFTSIDYNEMHWFKIDTAMNIIDYPIYSVSGFDQIVDAAVALDNGNNYRLVWVEWDYNASFELENTRVRMINNGGAPSNIVEYPVEDTIVKPGVDICCNFRGDYVVAWNESLAVMQNKLNFNGGTDNIMHNDFDNDQDVDCSWLADVFCHVLVIGNDRSRTTIKYRLYDINGAYKRNGNLPPLSDSWYRLARDMIGNYIVLAGDDARMYTVDIDRESENMGIDNIGPEFNCGGTHGAVDGYKPGNFVFGWPTAGVLHGSYWRPWWTMLFYCAGEGHYTRWLEEATPPRCTRIIRTDRVANWDNGDDICPERHESNKWLHFQELETDGSNDITIVALLDWRFDDTPQGCVVVPRDTSFGTLTDVSIAPYLEGINFENIGEPIMCRSTTLSDFIIWGVTNYPAEHYFLVMSDHGDIDTWARKRPAGGMWDQTRWSLTTDSLSKALRAATDSLTAHFGEPTKLDVIFFDACLYAMEEIAYEIKDFSDYIIFSEDLEVDAPYCQKRYGISILDSLEKSESALPTFSPESLAGCIVNGYRAKITSSSFGGWTYYRTMSAIRTDYLQKLHDTKNELAGYLIRYCCLLDAADRRALASDIKDAIGITQYFSQRTGLPTIQNHMDLRHFAINIKMLRPSSLIDEKSQALIDTLNRCVIREWHSTGGGSLVENSGGLAVYMNFNFGGTPWFTHINPAYMRVYGKGTNPWSKFMGLIRTSYIWPEKVDKGIIHYRSSDYTVYIIPPPEDYPYDLIGLIGYEWMIFEDIDTLWGKPYWDWNFEGFWCDSFSPFDNDSSIMAISVPGEEYIVKSNTTLPTGAPSLPKHYYVFDISYDFTESETLFLEELNYDPITWDTVWNALGVYINNRDEVSREIIEIYPTPDTMHNHYIRFRLVNRTDPDLTYEEDHISSYSSVFIDNFTVVIAETMYTDTLFASEGIDTAITLDATDMSYLVFARAIDVDSMYGEWSSPAERIIELGIHDTTSVKIPTSFALSSYPNPFNATVAIGYDVPVASDVNVAIYDVTGRKIETLVDEQRSAGSYSVLWNAGEKVASGVYFVRLSAGEKTIEKKIIYLK